jgi:hypothetical protein
MAVADIFDGRRIIQLSMCWVVTQHKQDGKHIISTQFISKTEWRNALADNVTAHFLVLILA